MQTLFGNLILLENLLLAILLFFPILLILVDGFFRAFFLILSIFFVKGKENHALMAEQKELHLLILILANNEERIIGETLQIILTSIRNNPLADVAVIADNCEDETASIAGNLGAKVYIRSDNNPGKGKALSWFVANEAHELDSYDLVAIIDADTIVPDDFVQKAITLFSLESVMVVQSFIEPKIVKGFPLTILAGYSEILAQKIDDSARAYMKWSVPLKGTGMIFQTKILKLVCAELRTQVDDIELSIRLAEKRLQVHYYPALCVIDPKTNNATGLARQRGRWVRGQRDIWKLLKKKFDTRLSVMPWYLSLLHALLIKPKTALFILKILLGVIIIFWHSLTGINELMFFLIAGTIIIDILYYFVGLRFVENVKVYFQAMFNMPLFFLLWAVSYLYSFTPRQKWLRSRD